MLIENLNDIKSLSSHAQTPKIFERCSQPACVQWFLVGRAEHFKKLQVSVGLVTAWLKLSGYHSPGRAVTVIEAMTSPHYTDDSSRSIPRENGMNEWKLSEFLNTSLLFQDNATVSEAESTAYFFSLLFKSSLYKWPPSIWQEPN